MLSKVAAEGKISCSDTALLNVANFVVHVVLSINAVEKDKRGNHREGQQITVTYGIYS